MNRDQMNAKYAIAKALLGKTTGASKGYKQPPDAETKVRPMGGLKPHGVKVTWKKDF